MGSAATAPDDPGCALRDWVKAIRAGDFARAWEISDCDLAEVRRTKPPKDRGPRHLQRLWRGEPLQGRRVLVCCYHGLGDTIQFGRFLSPLRAIAGEVTLWCQPELLPLMAAVEGVDRALALHDGLPEVDFDVDIEIMEVPHAIRASREQIEMRSPYLRAKPETCPEVAIGGPLLVGLVWDVGDRDRRRVVPAKLLKQLDSAGVQLYSL